MFFKHFLYSVIMLIMKALLLQYNPASLILMFMMLASPVGANAASAQSLIEKVEASLASDGVFGPKETRRYMEGFRAELAGYAFDILRSKRNSDGADVLLSVLAEGSFDGVPVERTVKVASAAYIAVRRGSPPEVVEGIALYGFSGDVSDGKIEAWANGYNDCVKHGVPPDIAEDLVYNAFSNSWDIKTYNIFKWGLVDAAKAGFDMEDFQAYLMGNYLKDKSGSVKAPGAAVAGAKRYFRGLKGKKPKLPPYIGSFIPRHERKSIEDKLEERKRSEFLREKETGSGSKARKQKGSLSVLDKSQGNSGGSFLDRIEAQYRRFLGVPYVWGGETMRGTDCSGFVQSVFARVGIKLPRVSRLQWKAGKSVVKGDLKKGDLVFFRTIGSRISHVGIFSDSSKRTFIHASSSKGVTFSKLDSKYYSRRYAGARRVVPEDFAGLDLLIDLASAR